MFFLQIMQMVQGAKKSTLQGRSQSLMKKADKTQKALIESQKVRRHPLSYTKGL